MNYLLDASGIIFRSYFAFSKKYQYEPQNLSALFGFCSSIIKILSFLGKEDSLFVIFDSKTKNFRYDIYPEYKKNRPKTPQDLIDQFDLVHEACDVFGLKTVQMDGYEADDLIASYAHNLDQSTIISIDKDLMQLIDEDTWFLNAKTYTHQTKEDVIEKFGVRPNQLLDLLALTGDASDNIPGGKGVGIKIASALLSQFETLENLFDNLSILPERHRNLLLRSKENIFLSKQLVTLKKDLPVTHNQYLIENNIEDRTNFLLHHSFHELIRRLR